MTDDPARPDEDFGRDPTAVADFASFAAPVLRAYFRTEVRGMEHVPDGGALIVSNHSGGLLTPDHAVLLTAFVEHFGADRPFHLLAHEFLFQQPVDRLLRSWGLVPASRSNARALLQSGAVTLVFPGGEYDAARPFHKANTIDFAGRTGYVESAIESGVPIVPCVSIGGHETQLFLGRGERIIDRLGLRRFAPTRAIPLSFGFPFGLSAVLPINLPLPSKISTAVLEPVDPAAYDHDVTAIDEEVRRRMQDELDQLAASRRFPVLG